MSVPERTYPVEGEPYLKLADGTVWPNPLDPKDVQWQLRYAQFGGLERSDRLLAASMMSAYQELIWMPERRLREVRRLVREASGKGSSQ